ncbi:MAG: sulfatase-like hydrolase/transferase [Armatimonadota bacterium]
MTESSTRPNVLLLFTDQHRLSALGCYGETPCRTPNLDRLAAEGVRFETAYTACPVCSPTRGTIMTGLYPHSHGVCSNVGNLGCSVHELPDRDDLLSRRLGEAGYRCGYTGKWHLGTADGNHFGALDDPALPTTRGFEGQDFPGHGGGGFLYPEYQRYLEERGFEHRVLDWPDDRPMPVPAGELAGPTESTVPHFLAEHTISLAEDFRESGDPWFIWHNNWGPHGPYYAPTEFLDLYRDVQIDPWPNADWPARNIAGPHQTKLHPRAERLSWEHWEEMLRHYYAFTTLIDYEFGRIVEYLRDSGQLDNTLIIFTSDHGETCGSHGGLTDKGWHHFEETHRIGMIVRHPDGSNAGDVRNEWASNTDVYPTVCDAAGAEYDADAIHGRSLLPLTTSGRERPDSEEWRDCAVTEFHGVNNVSMSQRTIRVGDLKFGWNAAGEDELYDLARDPYETTNVLRQPDYLDDASRLRERLLDWMRETADPVRNIYERNMLGYERRS